MKNRFFVATLLTLSATANANSYLFKNGDINVYQTSSRCSFNVGGHQSTTPSMTISSARDESEQLVSVYSSGHEVRAFKLIFSDGMEFIQSTSIGQHPISPSFLNSVARSHWVQVEIHDRKGRVSNGAYDLGTSGQALESYSRCVTGNWVNWRRSEWQRKLNAERLINSIH